METPWVCSMAAWTTATVFLLLLLRLFRRRNLNLPPGPTAWPVIGNLNLIGPSPHKSLHHLSQKYGPIMHLRFGSFPVVVGSSAETAKIFLKTHDLNFADRPKAAAGKYITYDYSNITWAQYGPYWRQARKIFLTELFSPKRLDSHEHIRREEINCFIKEIYNKTYGNNGRIELKTYLSALSTNVISRMALGKKYLEKDSIFISSDETFKEMIDELFLLSGVMNIGDWIPWMNFLDLQGYVKRMKKLSKKLDRFLEHVLDEHNERRKGVEDYVAKDMVDVLLQLADDHHSNLDVKLHRHGVKALTLDLIAGGTDTSTLTVEWAMSELLKNPRALNKAIEELDKVIGRKRWVEEKDIVNLPYINAIAKETMRLHPAVPTLVPRLCREDCQVAGYNIAKGTILFVNVWGIGRDPQVWENPNEFQPERFIATNIDVKGHTFEFLPFGSGRRMCPGYSLGFKVILSTLANLLHGFSWELTENYMKNEELNMDEGFGLTIPRKFPLIALAKPRLPHHNYNLE